MKTCRDCKIDKPLSEYHKSRERKDGHFCYCKDCCRTRHAEWRRRNPAKRRASHLRYMYGITEETYESLLSEQLNRCAICGTSEPGHKGKFVVDHNHKTNEVRGLLCAKCNTGLGNFCDSISNLSKATYYLLSKGAYG